MSITVGNYWCSDLNERLQISSLTPRQKKRMQEELAASVPAKHRPWPFGMPTSVNPFLVLLGLSPGAVAKNGERVNPKEHDYTPSVGAPHQGFDLPDSWQNPHWQKARKLCLTLLKQLERKLSPEECISLSGHLNLGTWQVGDGSDPSALDKKIIEWVPSIVSDKLKPEILILLGLTGKLRKLRPAWESSALGFVLRKPDAVLPLDYSGKRSYKFKLWKNPDSSAFPHLVISMPNHPSRHPFGDRVIWDGACRQLSRIVKQHS